MSSELSEKWPEGAWVKARGGKIPAGAIPHGYEENKTPLYVARAKYMGGLHPGKVRPEFKACNIGYDGQEVKVEEYEVFVLEGKWVAAKGGEIPSGALPAGHEKDGTALWACRAKVHEGFGVKGLHPGKVRPQFKAANIPYHFKEKKESEYEVLVSA